MAQGLVVGNMSEPAKAVPSSTSLPALGARIVFTLNSQTLEGKVGFAGETEFAPGNWIGVILDGPHGKNNGSVKDRQYFTCQPQHGLFVRPQNIVEATDANRKLLRRKSLASGKPVSASEQKQESDTPSTSPPRRSLPSNARASVKDDAESLRSAQERLSQVTSELEAARRVSTSALDQVRQLTQAMQSGRDECKTSLQLAETSAEMAARQCSEMTQKLEKSEETAEEERKKTDALADGLRKAEEELRAKAEELRSADEELRRQELLQAEMSQLKQELKVEQVRCQSKAEEVSRLGGSLQQERDRYAALQKDWEAAQGVAEAARAELLKASRVHIEQAKEIEAMSMDAAQRHSQILRQMQDLREELSQERQKLQEREAKAPKSTEKQNQPTSKASPTPARSSHVSFADFFLSHMCCSRGQSHTALVSAEDDNPQNGLRLDTSSSASAEGPIRAG